MNEHQKLSGVNLNTFQRQIHCFQFIGTYLVMVKISTRPAPSLACASPAASHKSYPTLPPQARRPRLAQAYRIGSRMAGNLWPSVLPNPQNLKPGGEIVPSPSTISRTGPDPNIIAGDSNEARRSKSSLLTV